MVALAFPRFLGISVNAGETVVGGALTRGAGTDTCKALTLILPRSQSIAISAGGTKGRTGASTAVGSTGSTGRVRINEEAHFASGANAAASRATLKTIFDEVAIRANSIYQDLVETITTVSTSFGNAATEITDTGATGKSRPRSTAEALGGLVIDAG